MSTSNVIEVIRGVPVPKVPWFSKKNITDAFDYIPHDGDIIIGSYPKTGTSWLQYIVQQIISKGESLPDFMDLLYKVIPFVEMAGIDVIEALPKPRIYKHHFAHNAMQTDHKAKYLYIYRNPEDVFISYYHFFQELACESISVDQFMDDFLAGNVWYGNYCDHVLSYLSQQGNSDAILMITYENLIANRKDEVLRIAKFLGEEYYEDLSKDDALLDTIVEHTEFEYMKKNVAMMLPEMPKKKESSTEPKERKVNYFRKGTVGDGKKSLSDAQLKRLREHVAIKMRGTHLAEEWLPKDSI